jgi:DNA-binding transcriptional regulator YdaS (Cro superfamily)
VLRFEARWLRERNFHEIVDNAWATGYQAQTEGLAGRLAFMHDILHQWDRSVLKKPQNKIKQVKREFEEITRAELNEENLRREKELAVELEKLLKQEEVYWAQRSRINWLKFGFFTILHLAAEQGME